MKRLASPIAALRDRPPVALWFARGAVALVCLWNLTAAVPFVLDPAGHVHSFEVSEGGVGAETLIRGLGITFLMWQVPFLPVIWHPGRQRICFLCILAMQLIGLLGESYMMITVESGHAALQATGTRFILFDGAGLLLIGLAYAVVGHQD